MKLKIGYGLTAAILIAVIAWARFGWPRTVEMESGRTLVIPAQYLVTPRAFWVKFARQMDETGNDVLIKIPRTKIPCQALAAGDEYINVVITALSVQQYAQSRAQMMDAVSEAQGSGELVVDPFGSGLQDGMYATFYSTKQTRHLLGRCSPNRRCSVTAMVEPDLVFTFSIAQKDKRCLEAIVDTGKNLVDLWTQP